MRPWTTRTLQAAVVAAGFAAAGTSTASAAEAPLPAPDLSQVPDEVGFTVPVDACDTQQPAFHPTKAPCADAQLRANTPNLFKQVGADIVTTTHGVAGELRDGRSILAPGKPARLLDHVFAETARLEQKTKTRPELGVEVDPDHTGLFDRHTPEGGFLEAELGPRKPDHEGVSTADTALELTAVRGYELKPLENPVNALATALPNSQSDPVALPKLGHLAPAANDMPALAMLDNGITGGANQLARQTSGALAETPAGEAARSMPEPGTLLNHLLQQA